MPQSTKSRILELIDKYHPELLSNWIGEQQSLQGQRGGLISETELRKQSSDFIAHFQQALKDGNSQDLSAPIWNEMKDFLGRLSYSRAEKGFSPSETAIFVFSF